MCGDLKANPRDLLVRYFDASLFFANWLYVEQRLAVTPAKEIDRWIAALDEREKVALLSRVARGEAGVKAELTRRFRQHHAPRPATPATLQTAGALRAGASELADGRRLVNRAREAKERARREREQAVARERHLTALAKRQADAWRRVEALVVTKRPGDYDAAVTLFKDLREIGERQGRSVEVGGRIGALREAHAKKPSLLARLRKAGL